MATVGGVRFAELLAWARRNARLGAPSEHVRNEAAHAIVTLLGSAWPCGMEEPPIVSLGDGTSGVLVDNGSDPLTPDELRGYAVRLLELAEQVEEQNG